MNSYRQSFYHIVFCTYRRENTLVPNYQEDLYRFIWGVIQNRNSVLLRINGTENHIHILCNLHSSISLSDFIKEIKVSSHQWIKRSGLFPYFNSWANGYCALSCSSKDKEAITNYIKNQKTHHNKRDFVEELKGLLEENSVDYNELYLE